MNNSMRDFLNPKSMITPGIAGTLMMFITNAIINAFPEIEGRYIALIISFMIGAVTITATRIPVWQRLIYYMLNSFIIFAVGTGTTNIGANWEKPKQAPSISFVSSAFAQNHQIAPATEAEVTQPTSPPPSEADLATYKSELDNCKAKIENLEKQLKKCSLKYDAKVEDFQKQKDEFGKLRQQTELLKKTDSQNFFKRW